MKKCSRCSENLSVDNFQKRKASKDGLTSACKKCLSEYDKSRAMLPHRLEARKKYMNSDAGKQSKKKTILKYRKANPNKYKAHNMINNAIRDGKLFSQPCEVCGEEKTHAHHDDYLKPLNVRWLCAAHHKQWHNEHGEALNP